MAFFDEDECNLVMRENSYLLLSTYRNPFELLQNHNINDTEIKCSDYLIEGQSNEMETQSNSNSDKKSYPNSSPRELANRFLDFDDNIRLKKKKEKKLFKVVAKKEEKTLDTFEKKIIESKITNQKNTENTEKDLSISRSRLMKIKRMKQKKVLEMTRGNNRLNILEENQNSIIECERKIRESISKKKKALQNRISAQKSIEKKKNLINQIKNEKENLSYENYLLKQELEKKNHEIEILKSKLSSISQQENNISYNFNFTLGKSYSRVNLISGSILIVCLIVCLFDHSEGDIHLHYNQNTATILPVQSPLTRISRRKVMNTFQNNTNLCPFQKDVDLCNDKQKIYLDNNFKIFRPFINKIDFKNYGVCKRRIYIHEICEKD